MVNINGRTCVWRYVVMMALVLPASLSLGQMNPSAGTDHVAEFTLTECEGINCVPWHFVGKDGLGRWKDGETAILRITDLKPIDKDNWSLSIHRVDIDGSHKKYMADYHGKLRKNGTIGGEFKSASSGDEGDWYAFPESAVPLPPLPALGNL